jgi:hypothetical protein
MSPRGAGAVPALSGAAPSCGCSSFASPRGKLRRCRARTASLTDALELCLLLCDGEKLGAKASLARAWDPCLKFGMERSSFVWSV